MSAEQKKSGEVKPEIAVLPEPLVMLCEFCFETTELSARQQCEILRGWRGLGDSKTVECGHCGHQFSLSRRDKNPSS